MRSYDNHGTILESFAVMERIRLEIRYKSKIIPTELDTIFERVGLGIKPNRNYRRRRA